MQSRKKSKENLNLAFFSRLSSQLHKWEDWNDQAQHLSKIIIMRAEDNAAAEDDDGGNLDCGSQRGKQSCNM